MFSVIWCSFFTNFKDTRRRNVVPLFVLNIYDSKSRYSETSKKARWRLRRSILFTFHHVIGLIVAKQKRKTWLKGLHFRENSWEIIHPCICWELFQSSFARTSIFLLECTTKALKKFENINALLLLLLLLCQFMVYFINCHTWTWAVNLRVNGKLCETRHINTQYMPVSEARVLYKCYLEKDLTFWHNRNFSLFPCSQFRFCQKSKS